MYGFCVCFETHIPISQVPIIMCIMRDHVFTKCMNALQQVQRFNAIPLFIYILIAVRLLLVRGSQS